MKTTGSNLATAAGLVLLLILLLVASYLHIAALEGFVIVLLLLCLLAWLWARKATDKITVSFREQESRIFPGETVILHMELHNGKFLPVIWLKIHVNGSESGILETASGNEITESFSWIMPHQHISWEYPIKGLSRGVLRMNSISLFSGDGFGLSDRSREISIERPYRLVVYPKIISVDQESIRRHIKEFELAKNGLYKDASLIKYIRPYTGRESLRDMNWRSLAKGGEEQINIRETIDRKRAAFLPDLQSFVYYETLRENNEEKIIRKLHTQAFEHMLSMIASFIFHLAEYDLYFSVLLPSFGANGAQACIPEDHSMQVPELLELLAQIDYNCEDTSFPPELAEDLNHRIGQIYVLQYQPETGTVKLPEDLAAHYLTVGETEQEMAS